MRIVPRLYMGLSLAVEAFAKCALRISSFMGSFLAVLMTPEEIVDYTRKFYGKTDVFGDWKFIKRGLMPWEDKVLKDYFISNGSMLVLGCGGGRESIALAKMGFNVTGVDSSEPMINAAKETAVREGVQADFRIGDMLNMPVRGDIFDYCIVSCYMYSAIPARRMRVKMLSDIRKVLKDGGLAVVHFFYSPARANERLAGFRRGVARILKGNIGYSPGDEFLPSFHFMRHFPTTDEVAAEAAEAGLRVKEMGDDSESSRYAVLEKYPA
ncbi:MAG: class I SAM-dependent methyltransferase [Candidatus Omnitrophica bacterium]|nr:class I SAM-dependent methyltransferase [Candidatus Omnitrophota bacterium]